MRITASIFNQGNQNDIQVATNGNSKPIAIRAKADGKGSSVNGGELLFAALATCFCNDLYREAAKRQIDIRSVEVNVSGEFGPEGEAARNIHYEVKVDADLTEQEIDELVTTVDKLAEIHNTLRVGRPVLLKTAVNK